MRYLGLDWGSKNIGLALSDEQGGMAFPYDVWQVKDFEEFKRKLLELIKKEKIGQIVLGAPLNFKQQDTKETKKIREIAARLEQVSGLEISLENEIFTSKIAQMHSVKKSDASAAALILQSFLDKNRR